MTHLLKKAHPSNYLPASVCAMLAISVLAFPGDARARVMAEVKIGIQGHLISRHWIPLEYTILEVTDTGIEGELLVRTIRMDEDNDIQLLKSYSLPVKLKGDDQFPYRIKVPVEISDETELLQFDLVNDGNIIDTRILRVDGPSAKTQYYLVVGNEDQYHIIESLITFAEVLNLEPSELPDQMVELDGVRCIVLADINLDDITESSWMALLDWLGAGGTLIITPDLVRDNIDGEKLRELIPLELLGDTTVPDSEEVDDYVSKRAWMMSGRQVEKRGHYPPRLVSASLLHVNAPGSVVGYADHGVPIIIQRPLGMGSVWLCTLERVQSLIMERVPGRSSFVEDIWKVLLSKVNRLPTGQFRTALATPEVATIKDLSRLIYWYVGIFFLVVGPVNYAILRRLDRREYILITVPIISLVVTGIAYFIGQHQRGGSSVAVRAQIQAGRAGQSLMSSRSNIGIMAENSRPFTIRSFRSDGRFIIYSELFSYGDIEKIKKPVYQHFPDVAVVKDLALAKWAMYYGTIRTTVQYPDSLGAEISLSGFTLAGKLKNNLPFALEDSYLIFKDLELSLGNLEPGQERPFELALPPTYKSSFSCSSGACSRYPKIKMEPRRKEEQLKDAIFHFDLKDVPFLMGWVKSPGPVVIELDPEAKSEEEFNLMIFQLPLLIDSGTVWVPPGASRIRAYSYEEGTEPSVERVYSDTDFFMARKNEVIYDITMPVCINLPVKTESLEIKYRRTKSSRSRASMTESKNQIEYKLWDWNNYEWVQVQISNEYEGSILIEDPERFLFFPEGIVKVKAAAWQGDEQPPEQTLDEANPLKRTRSAIALHEAADIDIEIIDLEYRGRVQEERH